MTFGLFSDYHLTLDYIIRPTFLSLQKQRLAPAQVIPQRLGVFAYEEEPLQKSITKGSKCY